MKINIPLISFVWFWADDNADDVVKFSLSLIVADTSDF